ncbi:MAG: FecR domain-containing protein [Polyangiaceae bacterium]
MNSASFERFGRQWADATREAPIDEQRSLVALLEAVARDPVTRDPVTRDPITKVARFRSRGLLVAALSCTCAVAAGAFFLIREQLAARAIAVQTVGGSVAPGAWLETHRAQRLPLRFTEGSEVEVAESSRVRVNSVDPRGASVRIERGRVRAQIVHRDDTRWAFAAGPFNVKVTGTVLSVDWRPERQDFVVTVESGSVIAEGPLLGAGRAIRAGQWCRVSVVTAEVRCSSGKPRLDDPIEPAPAASTSAFGQQEPLPVDETRGEPADVTSLPLVDGTDDASSTDVASESASRIRQGAASIATMRSLEKEGQYKNALAVAETFGISRLLDMGQAEDLLCLSRLGRYLGDTNLSRRALVKNP